MNFNNYISQNLRLLLFALLSISSLSLFSQTYSIKEFPQNSKEPDFSAVFLGDDIVFCSSRTKKAMDYNPDADETFFTDLFISRYDGTGNYLPAEPLKGDVNTFLNEGHATFSPDGLTMYYTANLVSKKGKSQKVLESKLGIFIAQQFNGQWIRTGEFPYNSVNGKFSTAHPCLADGGNTLYFASNRPGGYGGSDLYRCSKTSNGWSEPENLGPNVNDEGNEFFPFVNQHGTLFFTTDGRIDSEGMDIYCCTLNSSYEFERAFRLDESLNSSYDELAYCEKKDSDIGLFSSNRNGEFDDIFLFVKHSASEPEVVAGEILTEETEKAEKPEMGMGAATYMLVITESPEPLSFDDESFIYVKDEISEIRTEDGYLYAIYRNSSSEDMIKLQNELIERGVNNTYLQSIDTKNYETQLVRVGEYSATVAEELYTEETEKAKKPEMGMGAATYMLVITESPEPLSFDDESFIHVKDEISEIRTESGYLYAIYRSSSSEDMMKLQNELIERGVNNTYLQSIDTQSYETQLVRVGEYRAAVAEEILTEETEKTEKPEMGMGAATYMLVITESPEPLSFDDESFIHVKDEISEIRTEGGYFYVIYRSSSSEDMMKLQNELIERGVNNTYLQSIDTKNYESQLVRVGEYNATVAENVKTPAEIKTDVQQEGALLVEEKTKAIETEENSLPIDYVDELNPNAPNLTSISTVEETYSNEASVAEEIIESEFKEDNRRVEEVAELVTEPIADIIDTVEITEEINEVSKAGIDISKEPVVIETKPATAPEAATSVRKKIYLYHIVIDSVANRIAFEDSYFENINTEIAELKTTNGYKYTVLTASAADYLQEPLESFRSKGYTNARIVRYDLQDFSDKLVKIGSHSTASWLEKMNHEFTKLKDLKFDYNSSEILPESYSTLDYIASVMTLESGFVLKINAYTCNIGSSVYNQQLSKKRAVSVKKYLINKGIPEQRLITTAFGKESPKASNFTVDGRSTNRRVEFIIAYK